MLLRNPELAWRLGQRGHGRLGRIFNEGACVEGYRELLHTLTRGRAAADGAVMSPDERRGRGGWSRRGSGARRRTRSRPRSCSRRGPACRRSGRSRPRAALMPRAPAAPLVSAARAGDARSAPPGLLLEGAAFLVTVVAIALWAEPLAAALGVDAVERALRLALPLTLALQWALLRAPPGPPVRPRRAGRARRGALAVARRSLIVGRAGRAARAGRARWPGC